MRTATRKLNPVWLGSAENTAPGAGRAGLLTTKLHIPQVHSNRVIRPRLLTRLKDVINYSLTLISGPAGFGKTSLLSEWAAGSELPVAWLSLDAQDNDPTQFWSYFIAALQTLKPGLAESARALLHDSPATFVLEPFLTTLINSLSSLSHPTVIVLEDYHLIEARAIHDSLTYLLERMPPRFHLVLATRSGPPLPLARLRVQRQLNELRTSELRFTTEETAAFLSQSTGLQLEPAEIAQLSERTEGWIAGLQLAALSAQNVEVSGPVKAFNGSHRYVLDYLEEEVLQRQPPEIQLFLMQTSMLERLCAPLCEAITGQNDAQAMLERLERENVFIVPLDERREWYRYHRLFAEFLRYRLRRLHPNQEYQLHRRANEWHSRHGGTGQTGRYGFDSSSVIRFPTAAPPVQSPARVKPNPVRILPAPVAAPLYIETLSDRELEVLGLIANGKSNREIAGKLIVTEGTVKWHIKNIYAKLKVQSRTQAIIRSRELNLL